VGESVSPCKEYVDRQSEASNGKRERNSAMKKLAILLSVLLSGCYQVASHGDIQAAQEFCENRGGINSITIRFTGDEFIECQDGVGALTWRVREAREQKRQR
jgi:hypothetical protein